MTIVFGGLHLTNLSPPAKKLTLRRCLVLIETFQGISLAEFVWLESSTSAWVTSSIGTLWRSRFHSRRSKSPLISTFAQTDSTVVWKAQSVQAGEQFSNLILSQVWGHDHALNRYNLSRCLIIPLLHLRNPEHRGFIKTFPHMVEYRSPA